MILGNVLDSCNVMNALLGPSVMLTKVLPSLAPDLFPSCVLQSSCSISRKSDAVLTSVLPPPEHLVLGNNLTSDWPVKHWFKSALLKRRYSVHLENMTLINIIILKPSNCSHTEGGALSCVTYILIGSNKLNDRYLWPNHQWEECTLNMTYINNTL